MKRFVFIVIALTAFCAASFSVSFAETKVLKIGTGSENGVYSTVAAPLIRKKSQREQPDPENRPRREQNQSGSVGRKRD